MSEWSGYLYRFYTNSVTENALKNFENILSTKFGFKVENHSYADEKYLLFYKNERMLQKHFEFGYHLDNNGEGCIGLEYKEVNKFNSIANLHTFDNDNNFEPYNINLIFNDIYYFLLVLPAPIDCSTFSFSIFNEFKNALLE